MLNPDMPDQELRLHMGELSAQEMRAARDALRAEVERLQDVLGVIEIVTATGDGLDALDAMRVHMLASEGRADDECAFRLDPEIVDRVMRALRSAGND